MIMINNDELIMVANGRSQKLGGTYLILFIPISQPHTVTACDSWPILIVQEVQRSKHWHGTCLIESERDPSAFQYQPMSSLQVMYCCVVPTMAHPW